MDFLQRFSLNGAVQVVGIGTVKHLAIFNPELRIPEKADVWFGVAARTDNSGTKASVVGSTAAWVEIDSATKPQSTFPPSLEVASGGGYHYYWFLTEPVTDKAVLEAANNVLVTDHPGADKGSWNSNRLLRLPGTTNTKYTPPRPVTIVQERPIVYDIADFTVLDKLNRKTRHRIRTGDMRGFKSRSERDWAALIDLVKCGASDRLINLLFEWQKIGDRHRDAATPRSYLEYSIAQARAQVTEAGDGSGFIVKEDGYWLETPRGTNRVSTFTLEPQVLLDGSGFDREDAIVCNVLAAGYKWEGVTFSRSAFTTVAKLDKECAVAAWQWLGTDRDLRQLLPYLMDQLLAQGLHRVMATPVLGLHFIKGRPYFVGDSAVLSADEYWTGQDGPIAWLPSQREHPKLNLLPSVNDDELELLRTQIPRLNVPQVIWPMVGWYFASPLKPWLELQNIRFPVLNVTGIRGAGKTTLLQRLFMPLLGQLAPKSYDAGTTKFVALTLLGSTNGVPVAFSEFRYDSVERFIRFILLAYDTGHDPRGRPDQTTVDYPLSAPFSVDGEDVIVDAAARERIVAVDLRPDTIREKSIPYETFLALRNRLPPTFAGYYIQTLLQMIENGELLALLNATREEMHKTFPQRLPDRIRSNLLVAALGIRLFELATKMDPGPLSVLEDSLKLVFNSDAGRGRLLVDEFVEAVINEVHTPSRSSTPFRWSYNTETRILYFQMTPAHSWWLSNRRTQRRGTLEREAILSQLDVVAYTAPSTVIDGLYMYGLDLPKAQEAGLDVPDQLSVAQFSFAL